MATRPSLRLDVVLIVHVGLIIAVYMIYRLLMLRSGWFRREMRQFVKLSKRGPLYRLGTRVMNNRRPPTAAPKPVQKTITATSVLIRWRSKHLGMSAEARDQSGSLEVQVENGVTKVADVEPDTRIEVRTKVTNFCGESPWSEWLAVRTHQVPVKGGGKGPNYVWRQGSRTIHVIFQVPPATRGRDVIVRFTSSALTVALPTHNLLDDSPLFRRIRPDASTWELDGGRLLLSLEKLLPTLETKDHWPCVVQNHPTIDLSHLGLLFLDDDDDGGPSFD